MFAALGCLSISGRPENFTALNFKTMVLLCLSPVSCFNDIDGFFIYHGYCNVYSQCLVSMIEMGFSYSMVIVSYS